MRYDYTRIKDFRFWVICIYIPEIFIPYSIKMRCGLLRRDCVLIDIGSVLVGLLSWIELVIC